MPQQTATRFHFNGLIKGPISEAEARLLAWLDGRPPPMERRKGPRPARVHDGDIIRASLIRDVCTSSYARRLPPGRGILITGTIEEALDLSFCDVPCSLTFQNCTIKREIVLHHAVLSHLSFRGGSARSIHANGATIGGDFVLGDGAHVEGTVSLIRARVAGDLRLSGSRISNGKYVALSCDGMDVGGSVRLDEQFLAEGEVRLYNASVRGHVNCDRARLVNPSGRALTADLIKVGGAVYLRQTRAWGEVRMTGAECRGNIEMEAGTFSNAGGDALCLDGVRVKGSIFMREQFRAEGQVRLVGAHVGLDLDCDGGTIKGPREQDVGEPPGDAALTARRLRVSGNVYLNHCAFYGEVRLVGAHIGGQLQCKEARFLLYEPAAEAESISKLSLNAEGITVLGSVEISDGETNGVFDFRSARVSRNLSIRSLILLPGSATGLLAEYARVGGELAWVRTRATPGTKLILSHARLGQLRHGSESWLESRNRRIRLNGCVYDTIDVREPLIRYRKPRALIADLGGSPPERGALPSPAAPPETVDTLPRGVVDWLHCHDQEPFDPQPYEHLALILYKGGQDDEAKQVAIALEERRYRARCVTMSPSERWLNRTLGYFLQHGHSTRRVCWTAILFVLFGTLLFGVGRVGGAMTPAREEMFLDAEYVETGAEPIDYPEFSAFWYSLDSFVPVLDLHQETYWLPNSKAGCFLESASLDIPRCGMVLRWYMWFHVIVGWIATTFMVISVTGLVRRLPIE